METAVRHDETRRVPFWEDLVDVFISPASLFARRADANWVLPYAVLAAIAVVLYYAFMNAIGLVQEAAMQEQLARMAPEAAERARQGAEVSNRFRPLFGVVVPVFILFAVVAKGLLLWLLGKPAGARLSFRQGVLITTYASYVVILQTVAGSLLVTLKSNQGLAVGAREMSFGVARFLPADLSPVLLALAGRLDLFALWQLALWIVGLRVIARLPTGSAALVAGVVWLLAGIPEIGGALLQGMGS
jgi:hypothetical protein